MDIECRMTKLVVVAIPGIAKPIQMLADDQVHYEPIYRRLSFGRSVTNLYKRMVLSDQGRTGQIVCAVGSNVMIADVIVDVAVESNGFVRSVRHRYPDELKLVFVHDFHIWIPGNNGVQMWFTVDWILNRSEGQAMFSQAILRDDMMTYVRKGTIFFDPHSSTVIDLPISRKYTKTVEESEPTIG
ncbi:hypothetical protein HGA91_05515 [candidate division WWE3 bacterium]|nr:hypothetical protein [candidate division WWE3 bacterium]